MGLMCEQRFRRVANLVIVDVNLWLSVGNCIYGVYRLHIDAQGESGMCSGDMG